MPRTCGTFPWLPKSPRTNLKRLSATRPLGAVTAQNSAVQHIAGAFHTSPVDPLHQLMGIMPIDLHIQMLNKNAALRLYRLPLSSQLLARVPGPWGAPRPGLIPLPIFPPCRKYTSNLLSLCYGSETFYVLGTILSLIACMSPFMLRSGVFFTQKK